MSREIASERELEICPAFDIRFVMATTPFPIAMPDDLLAEIRATASETHLSQADVIRQSVKAGLPKVREQFKADSGRVTNVDPLPDDVLERIYSRLERDELVGVTAKELTQFQSQEEPG